MGKKSGDLLLIAAFFVVVVQGCATGKTKSSVVANDVVKVNVKTGTHIPYEISLLWVLNANPGGGPGDFLHPASVAVTPESHVVVVDSHGRRIQFYDRNGNRLGSIGKTGTCEECFQLPVACHSDGLLAVYVADEVAGKITGYNVLGEKQGFSFIGAVLDAELLGELNEDVFYRFEPIGFDRLPDGGWVVLDGFSASLVYCDSFWRPRRIAGGKNSRGEGKLVMPKSVVTGSDGVCYVSDSAEGKVVLFDMVGNTLGEIGGSAGLKGPAGLAVDPFGNVFIADTLNGRIVVLDRDGNLLREFTGTSDSDREGFIAPESVAVSNDGLLVVADTGRLSVSCFRLSYR